MMDIDKAHGLLSFDLNLESFCQAQGHEDAK